MDESDTNPMQASHQRNLMDAEQFIQAALDALSAHIAILDETGQIISVNAAWSRFGDENDLATPNACLGVSYLEVCEAAVRSGDSSAAVVAHGLREVIDQRCDDFIEEYPCHSDNVKRWFVMHVTSFMWEGERRFIVAHQNVTDLKLIQEELRENHERTQIILDGVPSAIITLSTSGQVESVNPAALTIFGYSNAESMFGLRLSDLVEYEAHATGFDNKRATLIDQEMQGKRQDGGRFPITFSLRQITIDPYDVMICIVQDISERKQIEAERLDKERLRIELEKERELRDLKDRFITMMSHELRTPLASIMLSGDMLKHYGERSSAEEKQMYLDNINTQVEQLTNLIQDVLTINRVEEQRVQFIPEALELVSFCHELVREFELNYRETHQFVFSVPNERLVAMADPKLIRSIFNNLLSNAVKYSPSGGKIYFQMRKSGEQAVIEVIDYGIGIPASDQARLFEPFHRGSNVNKLPGTGLGLSITQQAVNLHNGRLQIDSVEGQGTTARVAIPLMGPEH
jgi:PAS domain S-box-containing protein